MNMCVFIIRYIATRFLKFRDICKILYGIISYKSPTRYSYLWQTLLPCILKFSITRIVVVTSLNIPSKGTYMLI